MLDSVYHMTMKLLKHHIFGVKRPLRYATKSVNHYWFIILLHSVMSLPGGMCVTKKVSVTLTLKVSGGLTISV